MGGLHLDSAKPLVFQTLQINVGCLWCTSILNLVLMSSPCLAESLAVKKNTVIMSYPRLADNSAVHNSLCLLSSVLTVQLPGPIHKAFRLASVLAESLCKYFVAGWVKGTTVISLVYS